MESDELDTPLKRARQELHAHFQTLATKLLCGNSNHTQEPYRLEVRLGSDQTTRQRVAWLPGQESNGLFLVLGASGSGKTETLRAIGRRLMAEGFPVLTIDFHGDLEIDRQPTAVMSTGMSSYVGVNPMSLDGFDANESGLYDQRLGLIELIARANPALGSRQKDFLREVIEEVYRDAGIWDWMPASWNNPPPTFDDVLEALEWHVESANSLTRENFIRGCIAVVRAAFSHPVFRRSVNLSPQQMLRGSYRLDVSKLSDSIRFMVADTVLRKIFRAVRLMKPPRRPTDDYDRFRMFIIIDEAKILSMGKGDVDSSHQILNLLATEGRKFGLGLIVASQMSDHFGAEVKANAGAWLVMKPLDIAEAKRNAPNVGALPEDLFRLRGRGDGYFLSRFSGGRQRVQIAALPSGERDEAQGSG